MKPALGVVGLFWMHVLGLSIWWWPYGGPMAVVAALVTTIFILLSGAVVAFCLIKYSKGNRRG